LELEAIFFVIWPTVGGSAAKTAVSVRGNALEATDHCDILLHP
jgi:hypothetical protein